MSDRADPAEAKVAELLTLLGFDFTSDPCLTKALDFRIGGEPPVYVEAKQHHSDRIAGQMARDPNVVVFQGLIAVERFIAAARALRTPAGPAGDPDYVERVSRAAFPDIWKRIDANVADDDWNGGTALNLRSQMLESAAALLRAIASSGASPGTPIPMILHCPDCGAKHVDAPDPDRGWTNPPHRSHLCHSCGAIWRPADVATVGVAAIATRGASDRPGGGLVRGE